MSEYKGIPVDNILQMMPYVWDLKCSRQSDFLISVKNAELLGLGDLLSQILTRSVFNHFKKGLYRAYIPVTEEISLLRGRLNLPHTIEMQMRNRPVLVCDVDEFSENNIFNQILKTAVLKLLNLGEALSDNTKSALKHCAFLLGDCDVLSNTVNIPWRNMNFNANNNSYRATLQICRWIFEYTQLELTTGKTVFRFQDFEDREMEHFFENFVANYYKIHFSNQGFDVRHGEQIKWRLNEKKEVSDSKYLPSMKTDVVISKSNLTLIIDTKFYGSMFQYKTEHIRPAHMYQIYSYVNQYSIANDVHGLLIYAKPKNDDFPPDRILRYYNGKKSFAVMALDLSQTFEKVKAALDSVIKEYFYSN